MSDVFLALDSLLKRYIGAWKLTHDSLPCLKDEDLGASPCTDSASTAGADNKLLWKPVERCEYGLFNGLEEGLELQIRDELKAFYGSFWSNYICVKHKSGLELELIQLWNADDEARLKENMLGHVFAKRKNRLGESYFIGATDSNDVICLDHATGNVVSEKPGFAPHEVLADRLETFLLDLEPVV